MVLNFESKNYLVIQVRINLIFFGKDINHYCFFTRTEAGVA